MHALAIGLFSLLLTADAAADPAQAAADPARLVERALPLLEKQATDWVEVRKCAACHHGPMMIWTHHEAQRRGFSVNEKAVADLETRSLNEYLNDPTMQPTGQDKGYLEKPLGPGTVFLALGLKASQTPRQQAIDRLNENFARHQNDDGSWTTKLAHQPIIDSHDCLTAEILLALDANPAARQRAVAWLKSAPVRNETQPLALRAAVMHQAGDVAEAQRLADLLCGRQQESGGWSQLDGMPCDAVATGQALYALGITGAAVEVVERARKFLAATQQDDGSWAVHTRHENVKNDRVITYFGTAWAVLDLLQTMPR